MSEKFGPVVGSPKDLTPRELPDCSTDTSRAAEPFVPPQHSHRSLVLCFDGTGKNTTHHHTYSDSTLGDQFDDDVAISLPSPP